jgi:hypothetical protein
MKRSIIVSVCVAAVGSSLAAHCYAADHPIRVQTDIRVLGVDDDGPADFNSIQAAIDAANPGDTVKVAPGTYNEDVAMKAGVSLLGSGAHCTIIAPQDARGTCAAVRGADDCRLDGFTITGYAHEDIDGVYCTDVNNFTISHNVIKNNTWSGINLVRSSVVIHRNVIYGNRCAGIFASWAPAARSVIVNNTVWNNENEADINVWRGARVLIVNNIVGDIDCDSESTAAILYNDVVGQEIGGNNMHADPLFADPNAGDFHLRN